MKKAGLFFSFEGIDGCGKSTQIARVAEALREQNVEFLLTREPGGTPIAEKIRELVMASAHQEMSTQCEVMLYLAARAQHVHEKIAPALEQGGIVLCDRFAEATVAYQGYGRKVPLKELRVLNRFAAGGLQPDKVFLFDLPVSAAWKRMNRMNKELDRLESGSRAFHERIRRGYLAMARGKPRRFVVLDARESIESLTGQVLTVIKHKLKHR